MSINSEYPAFSELPDISPEQAARLVAAGIDSVATLSVAPLVQLVRAVGVFPGEAASWQARARLLRVPGISPQAVTALQIAGIHDPVDLARINPESLLSQLQGNREIMVGMPIVQRWIAAAKGMREMR